MKQADMNNNNLESVVDGGIYTVTTANLNKYVYKKIAWQSLTCYKCCVLVYCNDTKTECGNGI